MPVSQPNLEIEPEWCSEAVLSSISAANEPAELRSEESSNLSLGELPAIPSIVSPTLSESTSESEAAPPKPARTSSKTRTSSKSTRTKSLRNPAIIKGMFSALRSRRIRVAVTVVSLLFLSVMMARNSTRVASNTDDDLAEMDLPEFKEVAVFEEKQFANSSKLDFRETSSDAESHSTPLRFSRHETSQQSSPQGSVTRADHETIRGQTSSGIIPASASSGGLQGAILTGHIEFETPQQAVKSRSRQMQNREAP